MKYISYIRKSVLKIALGTSMVAATIDGMAQIEIPSNFYNQASWLINPAAIGSPENLTATLKYRDQWSKMDGAPKSLFFNANAMVVPKMGVGLTVNRNTVGLLNKTLVEASYAYHLEVAAEHKLSMGLAVGFFQNKMIAPTNDPLYTYDASVNDNYFNESRFQATFGASYKWKGLTVDVCTPRLFNSQTNNYLESVLGYTRYDYDINEKWGVAPSFMVNNYMSKTVQYEYALQGKFSKMVWAQVGYRTNDGLITALGVDYKTFAIGISHEFGNGPVSNVASGSTEMFMYYKLPVSFVNKN